MFVRTSMDSESQDATIITSALADPRIYSSMKMMTLDMHMNAITIFLSVSPSFSSSVLTMLTSRLTGVCMTNNSYQDQFLKITIARSLKTFIARKKGITILTFKVKTMNGLALKTNGVLCWIHHITIPLDRYCWDLWKSWTQQVYHQLVSLLYSLLLWNVRPPRNMCADIEYIDLGWKNGVMFHDIQK